MQKKNNEMGRLKKGQKLPSLFTNPTRRFSSIIGPRINPKISGGRGIAVCSIKNPRMPKINISLTARSAKDRSIAFNYDSLYADEAGRVVFPAPAAVITVNDTARTRERGLYEVVVEAKEIPGQYPIAGLLEPSQKTEYTVTFEHGYHEE